MWETLEKKYPTKSIESRLHLKRRLYRFQLKKEISIGEHMNNYIKLLTDLINVDVDIKKEDKALILQNSLSDEEYETFILTLINGKQSLNYNDMCALVNYEVRRKDKQYSSSSISAEALVVRGRCSNQKGKGVCGRQKSRPGFRDLKKNQCDFCKELGHWKVDCLRIKDKNKGNESKTEADLTQVINIQSGCTSRQMDWTQTHLYFYFLSLLPPYVTQVILSG